MAFSFKDTKGDSYNIEITVGSADMILEKLQVDLMNPEGFAPLTEGGAMQSLTYRIQSDLRLRANIIMQLILDQFEEKGVTEESVKDRFTAEVLLAASNAFWESWKFFFQCLGQPHRAAIIQKNIEATIASMEVIAEKVKTSDLTVKACRAASGVFPESSE